MKLLFGKDQFMNLKIAINFLNTKKVFAAKESVFSTFLV